MNMLRSQKRGALIRKVDIDKLYRDIRAGGTRTIKLKEVKILCDSSGLEISAL